MKLALFSDVHANAEALAAVWDVLEGADRAVCLGDLTGYYCQVNEVLDAVRSLDALCVLGNHDAFVLGGAAPRDAPPAVRAGVEYACRTIQPSHRDWLAALPWVWGGALGGRSFLLAHGSPWRPLADYLYADHPRLPELAGFDCDVIAVGQTHRVLVRRQSRPALLNPGSVGQPRDRTAQACVLLLDTETLEVEEVARPFDPAPVIQKALDNGWKEEWVLQHLRPSP